MRKNIILLLSLILIVLAAVFLIQEFYVPAKGDQYKYSSTEFIEPLENFIKCLQDTDCIKIKGSACSPSEGGVEVCVNKNYFQEYISEIDKKAGRETDVICPQVYLVTNRTCSCMQSKCNLM